MEKHLIPDNNGRYELKFVRRLDPNRILEYYPDMTLSGLLAIADSIDMDLDINLVNRKET